MTEWRGLLETADETKFQQPVSTENQAKWGELIANVNAHNAYHGGQILLLKKETSGVLGSGQRRLVTQRPSQRNVLIELLSLRIFIETNY